MFLGHGKGNEMDESISGRRWLQVAYRWLMPVALVAAISVAAVTVISAGSAHDGRSDEQRWSEGTESDSDCDHSGKRLGRWSGIAELVGVDVEGLKIALSEGKTLADIATGNDIEVQSVIDALVEDANERIDAWVEAGKLTEEEAETKKSGAATKIEDLVNNGFDKDGAGRWGKSRWRGHGRGFGDSVEHN